MYKLWACGSSSRWPEASLVMEYGQSFWNPCFAFHHLLGRHVLGQSGRVRPTSVTMHPICSSAFSTLTTLSLSRPLSLVPGQPSKWN